MWRWRSILKDDGAAALTEFVIVIPVVLLFFLIMLQFFAVVRASQLCNYAAYCAARVYAVQAPADPSPGKERASAKAKSAAAFALAPVSRLVPGEFAAMNFRLLKAGEIPEQVVALVEGWITARYVRLNPWFGGNVRIETSGSPLQVNVEIHYPQPIYIPGLAELWGMVGRGGNIKEDLRPLQQGLSDLTGATPGALQAARQGLEQLDAELPPWLEQIPGLSGLLKQMQSMLAHALDELRNGSIGALLPYPHINVRAKCSMGYEDWGARPQWRPRRPDDVDRGTPVDRRLEAKAEEIRQTSITYTNALRQECLACCEAQRAYQRYLAASNQYKRCIDLKKRNGDKDACKSEEQTMKEAWSAYVRALAAYRKRYQELQRASRDYFRALNQPYREPKQCDPMAEGQQQRDGTVSQPCDFCDSSTR